MNFVRQHSTMLLMWIKMLFVKYHFMTSVLFIEKLKFQSCAHAVLFTFFWPDTFCVYAFKSRKLNYLTRRKIMSMKVNTLKFYLIVFTVAKPLDSSRKKKKKRIIVPQKCLDRAMIQCEKYLTFRSHDDIDQPTEVSLAIKPSEYIDTANFVIMILREAYSF